MEEKPTVKILEEKVEKTKMYKPPKVEDVLDDKVYGYGWEPMVDPAP